MALLQDRHHLWGFDLAVEKTLRLKTVEEALEFANSVIPQALWRL
jgi:hypothetical protein